MVLDLLIHEAIKRRRRDRRETEYIVVYDPSSRIETRLRNHPRILKRLLRLRSVVYRLTSVTDIALSRLSSSFK